MSELNNLQISYLLNESVKKSGADFTKTLCDLGDGSMSDGVWKIWTNGAGVGSAITTGVFVVGIGAYVIAKNLIKRNRLKRATKGHGDDYEYPENPVVSQGSQEDCRSPIYSQSETVDAVIE